MPQLPFLLSSFVWNYGLGMTYIVVPLYAHALGLSGGEIGTLFSLPVLAQVVVNLLGGAYTDRVGGRRIMLGASVLMAVAALLFNAAGGFAMLFAGQLMMVLSRAAYWPATWSLASELPGARGVQMGRLNAITNLGQIVGTGSCGFILALAGFQATFLVFAAVGVLAWALGAATPSSTRSRTPTGRSVFEHFPALLRMPIVGYMVMCAYVSALPFSLSMSFFPLLLQHYGYDAADSGLLIALRAVGSIGAGLWAARFVRSGPQSLWPLWAGLAVAVALGALPLSAAAPFIAMLMLLVGVGSGVMTLYFQIAISEASSVEQRGSAMALGGMGWSVSHLTTPLIMGLITDLAGVVAGFGVLGGLALVLAALLALLRRWAFAQTRPA